MSVPVLVLIDEAALVVTGLLLLLLLANLDFELNLDLGLACGTGAAAAPPPPPRAELVGGARNISNVALPLSLVSAACSEMLVAVDAA